MLDFYRESKLKEFATKYQFEIILNLFKPLWLITILAHIVSAQMKLFKF